MEALRIAVFASHGGSNLQAIIDACKSGALNAEVVAIISNNSKSYALERARRENIPNFHLSSHAYPTESLLEDAILEVLERYSPGIIVLAGYMRKLGKGVLKKYQGKILNIHPSLLPKYGGKGMYGLSVHEAVLTSGDKKTGATVHLVDDEYDTGAILNQGEVVIEENDTVETLAQKVLAIEHELYVKTLQMISEGTIELGKYQT